jgi:hypothetical protein
MLWPEFLLKESSVIYQAALACLAGAVGTAVQDAVRLNAMAHDPASAVLAGRRESMDCTLEAVESTPLAGHHNLEGFVVVIATHLALSHLCLLLWLAEYGPSPGH